MRSVAGVERWNAITSHWSRCEPIYYPKMGAQHLLLSDGQVMTTGGLGEKTTQETWLWAPSRDTRRQTGSLGCGRYLHATCRLANGDVLAIAGMQVLGERQPPDPLSTAELWSSSDETWSYVQPLPLPYDETVLIALHDGRALVVGGILGEQISGSCFLFDPATRGWTKSDAPTVIRIGHTATVLNDGRVLVVGGWSNFDIRGSAHEVVEAELWDPAADKWSVIAGPRTPRAGHCANLLADGRVLITGGTHQKATVGDAEIWDPSCI